MLQPAARPWECGSPSPVTLWPGTRGWLTGVYRKHPKSLSLGAWTGSWGLGLVKWQRATKGTVQDWTCLWPRGSTRPLSRRSKQCLVDHPRPKSGARCPLLCGPRHPPGASLSRVEEDFREPDLKLCLARSCGLWPGAVAPGALGDGEAWQDHLSASRSLGDAAFTCACRGRGQRLGQDLSLEALGRLLQKACIGQLPKKGLVKNTLKPKHFCTF